MRQLIILSLLAFSSLGFTQNMGLIVGKVVDAELNNDPLLFAHISIKGTPLETTSDVTGLVLFENLADGHYTLVCNFVGYETAAFDVEISSGQPVEVKIPLTPSSVSLNELAALIPVAEKEDKTSMALSH